MRELIPPHKRTVELTFEIFRRTRFSRNLLHFPDICIIIAVTALGGGGTYEEFYA